MIPIDPNANEEPLRLRPAGLADAAILLRWRNQAGVRANSRNTGEVTLDEHRAWLDRTLADPTRELLIVEAEGAPVGQVRLDELEPGEYEISVSLDDAAAGGGLGRAAIGAAVDRLRARLPAASVVADVREGNERSLRAFAGAGFEPAGPAPARGFVRLRSSG